MAVLRHKESIHSGQFMVSNLVGGEEGLIRDEVVSDARDKAVFQSVFCPGGSNKADKRIDNSLSKLFSCMSKVYAHKLSSPKWNRFLGLKLRWKDKIRLNNLIWRCWHMQFIAGKKKLVFDFVNPLEAEDPTHEVEGGGTLMMGQYWKRRMDTVLAEYKSWRIYYKSHRPPSRTCHHANMPTQVLDDIDLASMISDADLFINAIMTDLATSPLNMEEEWTTLTNADFIQPGININMRSQRSQDDSCLQNMMNNNTCDASCSPMVMVSGHNPSLYHSSLPLVSSDLSLPLVTPTYNEMTEVPPMEISPIPVCQHSPKEKVSSQPLMMSMSPMSSSQHSPRDQFELSPKSYKPPKSEPSELANILKGGQYILEKRSEAKTKLVDLLSPSSIKQSVIVQAPLQDEQVFVEHASTSKKRNNLKRKHHRPEADQSNRAPSDSSFAKLQKLVPGLSENSPIKISKAAQLMKAADHIHLVKTENDNLQNEIELLKKSNENLLKDIISCQSQLSPQGNGSVNVVSASSDLEHFFKDHVRACSMQNWKYWTFSQLMGPLLKSFEKSVLSTSNEDLMRTSCSWLDQHVNLVNLRPLVTQMLKKFSVESSVLTDPKRLPLEALEKTSISTKLINN